MRIIYQSRNHPVTEQFKQHAQPRLEHLQRHESRIREARVVVAHKRGRDSVEITLDVDGDLIRGEDYGAESLGVFDGALRKVERQLQRYKDRFDPSRRKYLGRRDTEQRGAAQGEPEFEEAAEEEPEDLASPIVRTKSHVLKPMTAEEAVLQMEMVGHDFYVFFDGESERVGVVYKRRNGDYGLIEPEIG